jgi:hypothetical protein
VSVPDPGALDPAAPLGDPELPAAPSPRGGRSSTRWPAAPRPIKLQLTGPLTLGLALVEAGVPAARAFAVARQAVARSGARLVDLADRRAPGVPRVVVFDEPGLVGGLRSTLPLPADEVIDVLSGALAAIEGRAAHRCARLRAHRLAAAGAGRPRSALDAGGRRRHGSAGALGSFLERGGWVAWGAVPTDGPLGETNARYWRQLSAQWCELVQNGCDPVLLRRQALVSPVCGSALHDEVQADHVFTLSRELAEKIHDQVTGIRLSVGA